MSNRRQLVRSGVALAAAVGFAPRLSALAQSDAATPAAATPVVPTDISTLPLKNPGQLTIHADKPAYPQFFIDDDPSNGKGFESALAYAIGERLGFTRDQITWGYTSFNASYAPGPKEFDFYITQVSITEERKRAVDFSDPYYQSPLVVVTKQDSPVLEATTLAELAKFRFGAQVGTTSYDAIVSTIDPDQKPAVYNSNDDAKQALENGQVDAIVTDLPTAFYITAAELSNGKIVGQLPSGSGEQEQFGLVLDKGSPLTECVSAAVDELRADGTLETLVDESCAQLAIRRTAACAARPRDRGTRSRH